MTETPATLEEIEARIKGMTPEQQAQYADSIKPMLARPWLPQPGPQTEAYYSEADELLYGGAAGGGKTDLLIGLATTAHEKSLLFRRQSNDLDGLWDRLTSVSTEIMSSNNSVKKTMRTKDARTIEGGHLEKPGSEKSWQGRPHDLIGCDEAAQLEENKVMFVSQWLRSTTGHRCRLVLATNPPIPEYDEQGRLVDTGTGDWLKEWFAPWLDERYQYPAQPGELRWCYMRSEGNRNFTKWVDGPGAYDVETGEYVCDGMDNPEFDPAKHAIAKSRTFIKSLLKDNMYLRDTDYGARLSNTPEPLKSLLLGGSFSVRGADHPMQVIPTNWVLLANDRWRAREVEKGRLRQLVLAADIAQGGVDSTVLAPLYETDFFDWCVTRPGSETPKGDQVVTMLLEERVNSSVIALDMTGAWGASTEALLWERHKIPIEGFVASHGSTEWTDDMRYKFLNRRMEAWWKFRMALDPKSDYEICIPPDPRLLAQLTSPIYHVRKNHFVLESKEELRKRLGTSTDEADGVVMAWFYRDDALARLLQQGTDIVDKIVHGHPVQRDNLQNTAAELDDPLAAYR